MNPRTRGWLLVALQSGCIAGLLWPSGELLWKLPAPARFWFQAVSWLALMLLVVAGLGLGRSLTAHPSPVARGELVTSGMYRYVRHPIYSCLLVAAIAIALGDPTLIHLLSATALVGLLDYKSRFEIGRAHV